MLRSLLALGLTGAVLGLTWSGAAAAPAAGPFIPLQFTDTAGLAYGSAVTVTATQKLAPFTTLYLYQCRGGVYPQGSNLISQTVIRDGVTFPRFEGDCEALAPLYKLDNSGRRVAAVADQEGNLTATMNVREGVIEGPRNGTPSSGYAVKTLSFPCDAANPCALVVINGSGNAYGVVQASRTLTFLPDPRNSCAGVTPRTPTGSGTFSIARTYQSWATSSCDRASASPLLADYTEAGEFNGLGSFEAGNNDFAVSATGFSTPGDAGRSVPSTRPYVLTPLAAQATVIAFTGGYRVTDPNGFAPGGVPITELSLTMDEAAFVFARGTGAIANDLPGLLVRNPQLGKISLNPQVTLIQPNGALAVPDATTLTATAAWTARQPSRWPFGALRTFPTNLSTGSGTSQVPLASGLPQLRLQVLGSLVGADELPPNRLNLYLTDSATAALLGLNVAKIQNWSGEFVAPTPESMAAGLAAMVKNPDGTLSADPKAADPKAYPMPMVQYAFSPKTTFTDTARRDQLVQFLSYATTKGQGADLAAGTFPLPAALKAEAVASLPLIGSVPPPTAPGAAPAAGTGAGTGTGLGTGSGFGTGPGSTLPPPSLAGLPSVRPTTPGGAPPVLPPVDLAKPGAPGPAAGAQEPVVSIPAFEPAATTLTRRALPAVAASALGLMLFGATYTTSGRPVPGAARVVAALEAARRWVPRPWRRGAA